ncbi:hypothetical protein [Planctobacterium marinum]|uniref:Uncharacterized protein n=1 Tax=Planctobacterium marinum TaxID=1631968 RepID=A0AA48KRX0_9ALTE|nr:hypothetical protein MACH26_13900 [Planctobacterium marinum]
MKSDIFQLSKELAGARNPEDKLRLAEILLTIAKRAGATLPREKALEYLLPHTNLFANFDTSFINRIVETYADKMAIVIAEKPRKNAHLSMQTDNWVTFAIVGRCYAMSIREYIGEDAVPVNELGKVKTTESKQLVVDIIDNGKHFGDGLPYNDIYEDYEDQDYQVSYLTESYDRQILCIQIESHTFDDIINEQPLIAKRSLEMMKLRYRKSLEKLQQFSQLDVYQRLRAFMYEAATELDNGTYKLDCKNITQQTIANTIGCNRTMVAKELKALAKFGEANNNYGIQFVDKQIVFKELPYQSVRD